MSDLARRIETAGAVTWMVLRTIPFLLYFVMMVGGSAWIGVTIRRAWDGAAWINGGTIAEAATVAGLQFLVAFMAYWLHRERGTQ